MSDVILYVEQKENSSLALFTIKEQQEDLLSQIREEVKSFVPDMTTKKGRAAIASLAASIARAKKAVERDGKEVLSPVQEKVKFVQKGCKFLVEEIQKIQDSVREHLTAWEKIDTDRAKGLQKKLDLIINFRAPNVIVSSDDAKVKLEEMRQIFISTTWQEFEFKVGVEYNDSFAFLTVAYNDWVDSERHAAAIESNRIAVAEIQKKEREERIAKEAAEKAKLAAEKVAAEKQAVLERKAEADRKAAEQDRIDAENKVIADKAEAERIAEADKAASDKAIANAEAAKLAAEEDRKQSKLDNEKRVKAAAQAERDRAQKVIDDEAAAALLREQDKAHKAKINKRALDNMVSLGVSVGDARKVVTAIAQGKIPNIKISY